MRYAIINTETMLCVNTIVWDGLSSWIPTDGHVAISDESANIGDCYFIVDGKYEKNIKE